jgi:predicted DNA-binding transcriptional regulator AlpA
MSEKVLLTDRDVENIYGIPRSTQAKGRMKGGFCRFVKRGRSVYYLKSDFDEWIAGLRRNSTSDDGRKHWDARAAEGNACD